MKFITVALLATHNTEGNKREYTLHTSRLLDLLAFDEASLGFGNRE